MTNLAAAVASAGAALANAGVLTAGIATDATQNGLEGAEQLAETAVRTAAASPVQAIAEFLKESDIPLVSAAGDALEGAADKVAGRSDEELAAEEEAALELHEENRMVEMLDDARDAAFVGMLQGGGAAGATIHASFSLVESIAEHAGGLFAEASPEDLGCMASQSFEGQAMPSRDQSCGVGV